MRRLVHLDQAEAARERLVLADVLLVLGDGRRADDAHLAARERRLEHVGGVRRRAERRARADDGVRLVDEEDQVVALLDLVDDALDALLEHAAQHRARDEAAHLQLHDVRAAQARRNLLRLELDQAREAFDHGGLADARLADEHRRVGALAVAEDFDHLLNLFLAADGRRHLVGAREAVQRDAEVLEVGRQLELLLVLLLLLLARADARPHLLDDRLGVRAQVAQHAHQRAVLVLREGHEEISGLDGLAALRARALHRALEKLDGLGRDANALVDVLIACILKTLFNQHLHRARVEREVAHRRVEQLGLLVPRGR